jgi:hypothetical protein
MYLTGSVVVNRSTSSGMTSLIFIRHLHDQVGCKVRIDVLEPERKPEFE